MLKFSIRREATVVLDHVHGEFHTPEEILLQNKFSGRDFAMVIQPGDIISWTAEGGQKGQAVVAQVRPFLGADVPALGLGARIIIEIPDSDRSGLQ